MSSTLIERSASLANFAFHVKAGLGATGQKTLPSEYFYDDLGSALFEAITHLPEYGLTRADERLLRVNAPRIAEMLAEATDVIELGAGSGKKTAPVLRAIAARRMLGSYTSVDVSSGALEHCRRELSAVVQVRGVQASFVEGLQQALGQRRRRAALVLFLGSTIGNFDYSGAVSLLSSVRACLRDGDALLIGADLVKPREQLIAAYDDPTGVTAAFNLNLLGRINRELRGEFDLRAFRHRAIYDSAAERVEMHLESLGSQTTAIRDCGCSIHFNAGETIWTESSHKYSLERLDALATAAGFSPQACWTDQEWPFAEALWTVA